MNKIFSAYPILVLSYFLLLLTTCHAMVRDEEALLILGKDSSEFNDTQKTEDQKRTEEYILDDSFYPPLELWERFLASLDSDVVNAIVDQINLCKKNYLLDDSFSPKALKAVIDSHLKNFFCGHCSLFTCEYGCGKHPKDLLSLLSFAAQFSAYAKNVEGIRNDFLSTDSIIFMISFNASHIDDIKFFQKLEKTLSASRFVDLLLPQSLVQIISDKEHPHYMQARMLAHIAKLVHVCFLIESSAFREKAARIQNQQTRIEKMLSAGFKFYMRFWVVGFSDSDIPPVDYYFLNINNDESAEWEDVYDQCCPLSFDSVFQTDTLREVLDNYHQNKNRYDLAAMIDALKSIAKYVDSLGINYDSNIIEKLKKDKNKWCGYCIGLEAIDVDDLAHEQIKQNIASVLGDELVYVLGKLNIDLDSFDDVDDMHSQILNFCEKKYNNKDHKLDSLEESEKDKKVIANLRSRCKNKLASLKAIRASREKAEKFIENYRSELLPLLPLIASALTFLDPLKRSNLYKYLPEWKSLSKETGATIPNFLLWLEAKNIPVNEYQNTLSFSADKALVKFIDYVAYNSFWTEGSIPLEGTFIYVVSPDRSLYVAPDNTGNERVFIKDLPNTHLYNHSDISIEPWAISAGQMLFKGGKIIYVNRQSGHYKPGAKHLKYGIKSLKQNLGKSIFSKECLIDASLATNIEFNPQKKILTFSRFLDGPLLSPSEELAKDELSLFDLGFKD